MSEAETKPEGWRHWKEDDRHHHSISNPDMVAVDFYDSGEVVVISVKGDQTALISGGWCPSPLLGPDPISERLQQHLMEIADEPGFGWISRETFEALWRRIVEKQSE